MQLRSSIPARVRLGTAAAGRYGAALADDDCVVFDAARQSAKTPDAALQRLMDGNARLLAGKTVNCDLLAQIEATAAGQAPFAAIVGCIDSRVPPELVFDQRLGSVFAARIAGNFVNTDIIGSLEFATAAAGAKLVLVLGHSECGAIKGAIDNVQLGNLTATLSNIWPAVEATAGIPGERNSKNARVRAGGGRDQRPARRADAAGAQPDHVGSGRCRGAQGGGGHARHRHRAGIAARLARTTLRVCRTGQGSPTVRRVAARLRRLGRTQLEPSIFGFIWKYSGRQQLVILALSILLLPLNYYSYDIPKQIINKALGAEGMPDFWGFTMSRPELLAVLCGIFLAIGADQRRPEVLRQRLCRRGRRAHAAAAALPALQPSPALPTAPPAPGEPGRAGADDQRRDRGPGRLRRRGGEHARAAGRHAADQPVLHVHAGLEARAGGGGALSAADLADPQAAAPGQPAGQGAGASGPPQRGEDQRDRGRRARRARQRRQRVRALALQRAAGRPCSGSASTFTRRSS